MDLIELVDCFKKTIQSSAEILKSCQFDRNNSKHNFIEFMLHKNILTALTISNILEKHQQQSFDFNSIVNLTRNVLHSFKPYYYLTVENISEEEYEVRYLLYNAYALVEQINMADYLKCDIQNLELELGNIKQKIEQNKFFQSLRTNRDTIYSTLHHTITANTTFSKSFREDLVKKEGCFLDDASIFTKFFLDLDYVKEALQNNPQASEELKGCYKYFYKYLSNYVHSSAFSSAQLSDSRMGLNKLDFFIEIIISCNIFYLSLAVDNALEKCNCGNQSDNQINTFRNNFSGILPYTNFMLGLIQKSETAKS